MNIEFFSLCIDNSEIQTNITLTYELCAAVFRIKGRVSSVLFRYQCLEKLFFLFLPFS